MKDVYKKEHKRELREILAKFPDAKFLKSRNSIVLDNNDSIVKIGLKDEIFHEIEYMRAFSREFNVPKLIHKRLVKNLAYMIVEKVESRKVCGELNSINLIQKLIKIANSSFKDSFTNSVTKDLKSMDILIGKRKFLSILKNSYKKKKLILYLIHGDFFFNLIGSASKYYLIDFESVGYMEIEHEIAQFKYIDPLFNSKPIVDIYMSQFKVNKDKIDMYAIALLNSKLLYFDFNPFKYIQKVIYLYRLLSIIIRRNFLK